VTAPLSIYLNRNNPADPFGTPTIASAGSQVFTSPLYRMATADVDLDGRTDLVVGTSVIGVLTYLLGNGTGGFGIRQEVSIVPPGTGAPSSFAADGFAVADVNLDGTPDLVTANPATNANHLAIVPNATSRLRADIVDAGGAVLAAGTPTNNLAGSVPAFTAPAAGTYYLRVSGVGRSDYAAVVTRGGAVFDAEPNDTPATALGLNGAAAALGHVARPPRLYPAVAGSPGQIQEVDPATGLVLRSFAVPNGLEISVDTPVGLAFDGKSLFYLRFAGAPPTLFELDPDTGAVRDSDVIPINSNRVDGLAVLNGRVYVVDGAGQRIFGFDPATDLITHAISPFTGGMPVTGGPRGPPPRTG
jgi:hypothetical protein